jgi:hypothetical protein
MGFVEITNKTYCKPLIILSECYFASKTGMFVPLFALYENGQIIYRKENSNGKTLYYETILTKNEKDNFINSLPFYEIYNIKEQTIYAYEGMVTDQPMSILELNIKYYKKVRIDGDITNKNKRKFIPKIYLQIYDSLINYDNAMAYDWYPDTLCVKFNEPYSEEIYKEWPKDLPKINLNMPKDNRDNICLILERQDIKNYLKFYNNCSYFPNIKYENNIFSMFYEIEYPNINYGESMCDEEMFDRAP